MLNGPCMTMAAIVIGFVRFVMQCPAYWQLETFSALATTLLLTFFETCRFRQTICHIRVMTLEITRIEPDGISLSDDYQEPGKSRRY